ncbi:hypothetical protein [Pseudomonas congelans]|uniref:hypothetical protein n=1 Tax=Pseudomonas congelans TaxID=200452 RepID=UPI0004E319C2|nr:hypothetical protein [Pseudomonas congelans]KFE47496.1 hypothetical protein IV03_08500 [Pseudomonas congelans]
MQNDYFLGFEFLSPTCLINIMKGDKLPKNGLIWELTNEIKPVDLYCYLNAKYGPPKGIQTLLKNDDSDNLIHWDWALAGDDGIMIIMGFNFRTEIHLVGDFRDKGLTKEQLVEQFKGDFKNYGKKITEFRTQLEYWTQFVNPYKRIKNAVQENFNQLDSLGLNPDIDKIPNPKNAEEIKEFQDRWSAVNMRYSAAIGLVFGLRAMLPVLAESFINLLLFLLAKPELKENHRLFQSVVRQNIDIRVQLLHLHCTGFMQPVDYSSIQCGKFHTLMNERNNLLHGNVEIDALSFNNIYFHGKTPIFEQYEDHWGVSIGTSLKSVKFDTIHSDHKVVIDFIGYITSLLEENVKNQLINISEQRDLGFNKKTGRVGLLLAETIADFRVSTKPNDH